MPLLIIYILGLVLVPAAFVYVNYQYQWIHKEELKELREISPLIILAWIMWPLTAIIASIGYVLYMCYKHFIPD